jgi:hypothetical protein
MCYNTYVITHHIPIYFPINHRSSEIAVITHMYINPIWKIRTISIVYWVNLVDAQGRNCCGPMNLDTFLGILRGYPQQVE